jgi:hypothetical protein
MLMIPTLSLERSLLIEEIKTLIIQFIYKKKNIEALTIILFVAKFACILYQPLKIEVPCE